MINNDMIQRGCPHFEKDELGLASCSKGCSGKLEVYDWLKDLPAGSSGNELAEIRFKNTRKGIYYNSNDLPLAKGDIVAVEAASGHDIGVVSLVGELVRYQNKKLNTALNELPKIYRKAKATDIEKWEASIALEHETMIQSRVISRELGLNMKIGDVEYQGDKTKAIFYYIADERVDFRQLIKNFAEQFKVRVEMRQIGARQEAGRIGGIGPCGRELCCSTFVTSFVSVSTTAARVQELSLNPQKLAGQCGKLKCCLNYEMDAYMDASAGFPSTEIPLETQLGKAYHFKTDVFRGIMWYSFQKDGNGEIIPLATERVNEIIKENKKGIISEIQRPEAKPQAKKELDFSNVVGEESINRFDDVNRKNNKNSRNRKNKRPQRNNQPPAGNSKP